MAVVALTLAVETETLLGRLAFGGAEAAATLANASPYIAGAGFGAYGLSKIKLHEKVNLRPDRFIPGRFKPKTDINPAFVTPKKRGRLEIRKQPFISPARKRVRIDIREQGQRWHTGGRTYAVVEPGRRRRRRSRMSSTAWRRRSTRRFWSR